jgi:hypothetical protein
MTLLGDGLGYLKEKLASEAKQEHSFPHLLNKYYEVKRHPLEGTYQETPIQSYPITDEDVAKHLVRVGAKQKTYLD